MCDLMHASFGTINEQVKVITFRLQAHENKSLEVYRKTKENDKQCDTIPVNVERCRRTTHNP